MYSDRKQIGGCLEWEMQGEERLQGARANVWGDRYVHRLGCGNNFMDVFTRYQNSGCKNDMQSIV